MMAFFDEPPLMGLTMKRMVFLCIYVVNEGAKLAKKNNVIYQKDKELTIIILKGGMMSVIVNIFRNFDSKQEPSCSISA